MITKNLVVMFIDMKGFVEKTARQTRQEQEQMLAQFKELLLPKIEAFNGTLLRTEGDRFLLVFESATNALLSAIECHKELEEYNRNTPDTDRIEVYIVLSSGDVIIQGSEIYGDAVNLAARMEEYAEANEIIFSDTVYQSMNKKEISSAEIGYEKFRGIPERVKLHKVVLDDSRRHIGVIHSSSIFKNLNQTLVKATVGAAVLLVCVAVIFFALPRLRRAPVIETLPKATVDALDQIEKAKKSIVILPFVNMSPEAETEYFSDGMTEEVISNLSMIKDVRVISRTSAMKYKDSDKDAKQIGRELAVNYLLEGSVRKYGDDLRITAQLINAAEDSHLWVEKFDKKLEDVFAVQDEISQKIVQSLEIHLTESEEKLVEKRHTENLEAYDHYLRGRYHINRINPADAEVAQQHFEKALELDENYAPAYAAIAHNYSAIFYIGWDRSRETVEKIREAVQKALSLDENLPEAHYSLACLRQIEGKSDETIEELKRAIALKSSYADAHYWLASAYVVKGMVDEGMEEYRMTLKLDPLGPPYYVGPSLTNSLYLRNHDEAIAMAKRGVEIDPFYPPGRFTLAFAYLGKGMYEECVEETQRGSAGSPDDPFMRSLEAVAFAHLGKREETEEDVQRALKIVPDPQSGYSDQMVSYNIAWAYAVLGERNLAIQWVGKAIKVFLNDGNEKIYDLIDQNPDFDALRNEPRFIDLMD